MPPHTGVGARREIPPAELPGVGHETFGNGEINAFEDIGPAKQHLVPDGFRKLRMRIDGNSIEPVHGIRPEYRPGRLVGEIFIKPLRQELHEVRVSHSTGTAQKSFLRDVVTTKSFR